MIIKPYQLLNEKIVNKGKGMSNNTFTRFIGPGDSVFSLFMRSCCSKSLEDAESNSYEFVIYDKNPKNIEMFKYVLNWECPEKEDNSPWYWTAEDFKNFQDYVESPLAPRRLDSFTFDTFYLLEEMSFKSFDNKSYDFRKAWNIFKKSKFIFLEIDAVKDNKEFIGVRKNNKSDNYTCRIGYNYKDYHLGTFKTIEEAYARYNEALLHIDTDFLQWYETIETPLKSNSLDSSVGVYKQKNVSTFFSQITFNYKQYSLGSFKTELEAVDFYDKFANASSITLLNSTGKSSTTSNKINEMTMLMNELLMENTQLKDKVKYLEDKIKKIIAQQIEERKKKEC